MSIECPVTHTPCTKNCHQEGRCDISNDPVVLEEVAPIKPEAWEHVLEEAGKVLLAESERINHRVWGRWVTFPEPGPRPEHVALSASGMVYDPKLERPLPIVSGEGYTRVKFYWTSAGICTHNPPPNTVCFQCARQKEATRQFFHLEDWTGGGIVSLGQITAPCSDLLGKTIRGVVYNEESHFVLVFTDGTRLRVESLGEDCVHVTLGDKLIIDGQAGELDK